MIPIPIKLLHPDAQIPKYQSTGASGMDLHCVHPVSAWGNVYAPDLSEPETLVPFWRMTACVEQITKIVLSPGDRVLFSTGISLSIPPGYEGQIRPRSGWALKDGITVLNSPGTIDSDYIGEIKVLLINLGHESVEIKRGDRIAQLVIAPVARAALQTVEVLGETGRGSGGFGSSGK